MKKSMLFSLSLFSLLMTITNVSADTTDLSELTDSSAEVIETTQSSSISISTQSQESTISSDDKNISSTSMTMSEVNSTSGESSKEESNSSMSINQESTSSSTSNKKEHLDEKIKKWQETQKELQKWINTLQGINNNISEKDWQQLNDLLVKAKSMKELNHELQKWLGTIDVSIKEDLSKLLPEIESLIKQGKLAEKDLIEFLAALKTADTLEEIQQIVQEMKNTVTQLKEDAQVLKSDLHRDKREKKESIQIFATSSSSFDLYRDQVKEPQNLPQTGTVSNTVFVWLGVVLMSVVGSTVVYMFVNKKAK